IGNIGASDQKDKANGAKQDEQSGADISNRLAVQRHNRSAPPGIHRGILLLKALRNGGHLGLRLSYGHSGFQARNHLEIMTVPYSAVFVSPGQRSPQLRKLWKLKARLHHANDRIGMIIEGNLLSDYRWIGTEGSAPQIIAKNNHVTVAWLVFFGGQHPSQHRAFAEYGEKIRRNRRRYQGSRFTFAGQVKVFVAKNRHVFKDVVLFTPVEIIGGRNNKDGNTRKDLLRRHMPDLHQPFRILEGQRTKHYSVDDAKDSRIRADSQCQGDDCQNSECRTFEEDVKTIFQVSQQVSHLRNSFLEVTRSLKQLAKGVTKTENANSSCYEA